MALPVAALRSFCETIFETKTRTLDSFNPIAVPEIMAHAVNVKQYARPVYEDALTGGRITQAQYDNMAAMPNFPAKISDQDSTAASDQSTMDVVPESEG